MFSFSDMYEIKYEKGGTGDSSASKDGTSDACAKHGPSLSRLNGKLGLIGIQNKVTFLMERTNIRISVQPFRCLAGCGPVGWP
jgi:hypothetical protein